MSKHFFKKPNKRKKTIPDGSESLDEIKKAVFALGGNTDDLKLIEDDKTSLSVEDDVDEESLREKLVCFIDSIGLSDQQHLKDFVLPDEDDLPSNQIAKDDGFHFAKEIPTNRNNCLIGSGIGGGGVSTYWHTDLLKHNDVNDEEIAPYWLQKIQKYAEAMFQKEIDNYGKCSNIIKSSNAQWMRKVLQSGTLKDKINAQTVLIQEAPVHNLATLEQLISFVSLKSRRQCLMALDVLRDLFINYLLVPDRKLRSFKQNQFLCLNSVSMGNKDTRDRILLLWIFEDKLKESYDRFLKALDDISKDSIEKIKLISMAVILDLLISNPESEEELLSWLVNKLGDPSRCIAAKAMFLLGKLLIKHPVMQGVVLDEVERLLHRPNIKERAQYYSICFLSQMVLHQGDFEVANKLIRLYFSFFKSNIKRGEINTRLMSALLTGVNRSFPFSDIAHDKLKDELETIYHIVHISPSINITIQAMMLLYQISTGDEIASDRFYSVLYRKLADPRICLSTKNAMFLSLVFKALKRDSTVSGNVRTAAFVKRLLGICQYLPPHVICAILYLVSELINLQKPGSHKLLRLLPSTTYKEIKYDSDDNDYDEDAKVAHLSSWNHKQNLKQRHATRLLIYDPMQRNPLYSGVEHCLNWELNCLMFHSHPSVALFAQALVKYTPIVYDGDPLQDFTLIRFLDRFVFRNPKKLSSTYSDRPQLAKRSLYRPSGLKALAPDSQKYLSHDESSIPPDELFMYHYFRVRRSRNIEDTQDIDADSVTSEDFDSFLDKMSGPEGLDKLDFSSSGPVTSTGYMIENDDQSNSSSNEEEDLTNIHKGRKRSRENDINSMLASADQFSHLLDAVEDGRSGGVNDVSNKENASVKQLKWETKRRNIHGRKKKRRNKFIS